MDRMQNAGNASLARARSEGPGSLSDQDKKTLIAYKIAAAGAKKLTGGEERLNDDVEKDIFPVEVQDRKTGEKYTREEGIPIGGLREFLILEWKRLNNLSDIALREKRYEDAATLREESGQIFKDDVILGGNVRFTSISLQGDYRHPDVTREMRKEADFQKNRVGTEAYLRSVDDLIKELGGESQDESWVRAEEDILKNRVELKIPPKKQKNPVIEPISAPLATVAMPVSGDIEVSETEAVNIGEEAPNEKERGWREKVSEWLKGTKFGDSLKDRVKKWIEGPPMSKSRRAALIGIGALAGAAALKIASDRLPSLDIGLGNGDEGQGDSGGTSGANAGGGWESAAPFPSPGGGPAPMDAGPKPTPEIARVPGPYKQVEVDIPGKGKEKLNIRVLRGDEPDIFNVPPTPRSTENNQPAPVAISGTEVRRVFENPQADDETAKLIRSYLDEDTVRLVNSLPNRNIQLPTLGPDPELPREPRKEYASLLGEFEANWASVALGRPFDMRSPEDIAVLESLKNTPAYEQAWKVVVADRLLRSLDHTDTGNFGVVGFLSDGKEIRDIIVTAAVKHPYHSRNISSLQRTRLNIAPPKNYE